MSFDVRKEEQTSLLNERAKGSQASPGLQISTNKYRLGPEDGARFEFCNELLAKLRTHWIDHATEEKFLKLASILDLHGCAMFGGLMDVDRFQQLIVEYNRLQDDKGNRTFLHSYINLANHPGFLTEDCYNEAFAHPLLIALIAYAMGGAVRITDIRAKDTEPISANAQDNMLHIDNTPFRQEFKVLIGWRKGVSKGPSGQNFTYLPGTHKGNRDVLFDDSGLPWSTERDSLFVSDAAIDKLFKFQKDVTGHGEEVIEAQYSKQPLTITFAAGALVHHRYRTESGNPRSCMIAAFHVCSDNPGSLVTADRFKGKPASLAESLIGPRDEQSTPSFFSLLVEQAQSIELKLSQIFDQSHHSTLIKTEDLRLRDTHLSLWRKAVLGAPYTSCIKLTRNKVLSGRQIESYDDLTNLLSSIMMYDKHGLLQLILYHDGREEIRKVSRKKIGEINHATIATRLAE